MIVDEEENVLMKENGRTEPTQKMGSVKGTISYTLEKNKIFEAGLPMKRDRIRADITFKKETAKTFPEVMKCNKTRYLKHST